jgi:acetyl-CoA acetyltransferase
MNASTTGASIVGAGFTEFSKNAGRSETQLAAEAIAAAAADAGLEIGDIDGLVSYTIDPVEEVELVRATGITEVTWSSRIPYGGAGSQGVLAHAAAAVTAGSAHAVAVWRAIRARSGRRFGAAAPSPSPVNTHAGTTAAQWAAPFGVLTPASWISLNATRYMHQFGVTNEDFGRAVVQLRDYAARNPAAYFYERPITLEEHQQSRWIAEPALRLFDCCQETDGAVAFVITGDTGATDTRAPVRISRVATAGIFDEEVASNHYRPDLAVMDSSAAVGRQLFDAPEAEIGRDDLDLALIYDAFTPVLFMQLEALGFCGFGEAKDFIADGQIGPAGSLPTNTNGGLIGEGYIHGLNLTLEAVQQLRGRSANQLDDPQAALVAAGRTGVVLTQP